MADHLQPYHHAQLTDRALADVYDDILALFGRHDVRATFAYVMAFTLDAEERRAFAEILEERPGANDSWLAHFWEDVKQGRTEGWFQPHALDAVRADGRHEIACHGFCHRPLADGSISAQDTEAELEAALAVGRLKKVSLKTFVYPRNEVGHLAALRRAGFIGYREKLPRPDGRLGRIVRLAEELNVRPALQRAKAPRGDGLVPIPPGYFLNWRFGARRRIPAAVTLKRWRSLLDRTAEAGAVAHLWLHPHNLITAPDTADLLEAVVEHAAKLARAGRLSVETQESYSRKVLATPSPAASGANVAGGAELELKRL